MINVKEKAATLIEALPYIQKYVGKTIVIKYGGNSMISEEMKQLVISDIVWLKAVGINVVLVHGGGPEIGAMLKKIGKESKFINGLRYTDDETMDIVQMVLAGKINKELVSLINQKGAKAIGICGLDCGIIKAQKKGGEVDYGLVGEITGINTEPLVSLIDKGYIPVVSTIAQAEDGSALNINADTAAARIASALLAEKIILLTDVKGVLKDKNDEDSLIPEIRLSEVPGLKKDGVISGGMIPKIDCCVEAVREGVKNAAIIDGRVEHSILLEIFSDEGTGTMLI